MSGSALGVAKLSGRSRAEKNKKRTDTRKIHDIARKAKPKLFRS